MHVPRTSTTTLLLLLACVLALSSAAGCLAQDDQQQTCSNSDAAEMPSDKAKAFVQGKLTTKKVVVFSKSFCPYCKRGVAALQKLVKPEDMEVVQLDTLGPDDNIIDIQDVLGEMTGARSVPRVFIDGTFIGGGDDTVAKAASGELAKLLTAAGVAVAVE